MRMPKLLISACLLLALAAATPALTASPAGAQSRGREVKFVYHTMDSPERIYAHLRHTAAEACADHGSRSLKQSMIEQRCTDELLEAVVNRIGRADIAEIHGGWIERRATAAISSDGYAMARN